MQDELDDELELLLWQLLELEDELLLRDELLELTLKTDELLELDDDGSELDDELELLLWQDEDELLKQELDELDELDELIQLEDELLD